MIAKERLLSGLFELEYVEEGMVTLYTNFTKALVQHTEGMEDSTKAEITKLLTRLYSDTSRHKKIVDELIKQVEESARDEY